MELKNKTPNKRTNTNIKTEKKNLTQNNKKLRSKIKMEAIDIFEQEFKDIHSNLCVFEKELRIMNNNITELLKQENNLKISTKELIQTVLKACGTLKDNDLNEIAFDALNTSQIITDSTGLKNKDKIKITELSTFLDKNNIKIAIGCHTTAMTNYLVHYDNNDYFMNDNNIYEVVIAILKDLLMNGHMIDFEIILSTCNIYLEPYYE